MSNTGDFGHHADEEVQCKTHCLMEHIQGCDYHTFLLANLSNLGTQHEPSTQLINATSCAIMWDATIQIEEEDLSYFSSYQTLSAGKNLKSY